MKTKSNIMMKLFLVQLVFLSFFSLNGKKLKHYTSNTPTKKNIVKKYIGSAESSYCNAMRCFTHQQASLDPKRVPSSIDAILESQLDGITPNEFAKKTLRNYMLKHSPQFGDFDNTRKSMENRSSILHRSFFKKYLQEVYNDPQYMQILSQNATYIIEFLDLSNEFALSCEDVYVVLRLFNLKLKECEIIDDTVLNQFMPQFPSLVKRYFKARKKEQESFVSTKKNIENLLLTKFTSELELFNEEPGQFITELSDSLASLIEMTKNREKTPKDKELEHNRSKLRQIITSLFQTMVERTLWNTKSHESIVNSFISMGDGIILLGTKGIIDDMDDLDNLLWSLNHRFIYFLDVFGSSLPQSFYEHLDSSLESGEIFFIELDEQDEGIKTKKEHLKEAILKGKTKALAFEKGIVSEVNLLSGPAA